MDPVLLLVALGALWAVSQAGAGVRAAPGGAGGSSATPGGRDEWWNTGPVAGPSDGGYWLDLTEIGGSAVYTRGGNVYSSVATLIPAGRLLERPRLFGTTTWRIVGDGTLQNVDSGEFQPIAAFETPYRVN